MRYGRCPGCLEMGYRIEPHGLCRQCTAELEDSNPQEDYDEMHEHGLIPEEVDG
jgi:hypothetical protein